MKTLEGLWGTHGETVSRVSLPFQVFDTSSNTKSLFLPTCNDPWSRDRAQSRIPLIWFCRVQKAAASTHSTHTYSWSTCGSEDGQSSTVPGQLLGCGPPGPSLQCICAGLRSLLQRRFILRWNSQVELASSVVNYRIHFLARHRWVELVILTFDLFLSRYKSQKPPNDFVLHEKEIQLWIHIHRLNRRKGQYLPLPSKPVNQTFREYYVIMRNNLQSKKICSVELFCWNR